MTLEYKTKNWSLTVSDDTAQFFLDQFGDAFVRVKAGAGEGDHFEVQKVRSRAFRRIVAAWLMMLTSPSQSKVADVCSACEAQAVKSGVTYSLYNRYARLGEKIYIDLGGRTWEAVEISKNGWRVTALEFPLFRRYSHFREIVVAALGTREDFDRYMALFNLRAENKLLHEVWLGSALIPGFPHVILILHGPQGAAKSLGMKFSRILIDNSQILVLAMPTKQEQLAQTLMHHYMPNFDNVDSLTDWQSDMLCRAVTGEGVEKRELYSDDDDVVYHYQRVASVNGINPPGVKPDFIDRACLEELERIPKSERRPEQELIDQAGALAPRALAYLYDVVVKSLNLYDAVKEELRGQLPRMADATIVGEACARALGYNPLEFYNLYTTKLSGQARDVVTGSTIGSLLLAFLASDDAYADYGVTEAEPLQCYEAIVKLAKDRSIDIRDRSFPKAPHILTRKLTAMKPNLLELGIQFSSGRSDKRLYTFKNMSKVATYATEATYPDDKNTRRYPAATEKQAKVATYPDATEKAKTKSGVSSVVAKLDDKDATDASDATLPNSKDDKHD